VLGRAEGQSKPFSVLRSSISLPTLYSVAVYQRSVAGTVTYYYAQVDRSKIALLSTSCNVLGFDKTAPASLIFPSTVTTGMILRKRSRRIGFVEMSSVRMSMSTHVALILSNSAITFSQR